MLAKALAVVVAMGCVTAVAQSKFKAPATSYTYSTITFPGATTTSASGINKYGEIVGYYTTTEAVAGFLYTNGNFQSIKYAPGSSTYAGGIHNIGQIVGDFFNPACTNPDKICAFVDVAGVFNILDVPGSNSTTASGIND